MREWLSGWQGTRMCQVLTGHAGNRNAVKLTRARKEELKTILARPPSWSGVRAEFGEVPAVCDGVKIWFDARYQVGPLLPAALALVRHEPRPARADKCRDEAASTRRMAEVKTLSRQPAAGAGLGGLHGRRGPRGARGMDYSSDVTHEGPAYEALRGLEEGGPVVLQGPEPDQQDCEALLRLGRSRTPSRSSAPSTDSNEKPARQIAVRPGQRRLLSRQDTAKGHISDIQREALKETFKACVSYITGCTFAHDFWITLQLPSSNCVKLYNNFDE